MNSSYITKSYDALDLICDRHYGQQAGAVEQVLAANPSIRRFAHRLPAGTKVILPDLLSSTTAQQPLRLWD